MSHISRLEFIFRFILPGAVRVRFSELERDGERRTLHRVRPPEHYHDSGLSFIVSGDVAFSLSRSCTFPRAPGFTVITPTHHRTLVPSPTALFATLRAHPEFRSAGGSIPSLGDAQSDKILICHDARAEQ